MISIFKPAPEEAEYRCPRHPGYSGIRIKQRHCPGCQKVWRLARGYESLEIKPLSVEEAQYHEATKKLDAHFKEIWSRV